jgi:hypothetical protein
MGSCRFGKGSFLAGGLRIKKRSYQASVAPLFSSEARMFLPVSELQLVEIDGVRSLLVVSVQLEVQRDAVPS